VCVLTARAQQVQRLSAAVGWGVHESSLVQAYADKPLNSTARVQGFPLNAKWTEIFPQSESVCWNVLIQQKTSFPPGRTSVHTHRKLTKWRIYQKKVPKNSFMMLRFIITTQDKRETHSQLQTANALWGMWMYAGQIYYSRQIHK